VRAGFLPSGKHEVGVIAEEVASVFPEIVQWETNGKDAIGVDYSRLTAILIEATKEQYSLVRQQRELIRAQQKEIREVQAQGAAQSVRLSELCSQLRRIQMNSTTARSADSGCSALGIKTSSRP
jgi:hypothetical protein